MTLLLMSMQGGTAWVSTTHAVMTKAASSSLRYHTRTALGFRCGGGEAAAAAGGTGGGLAPSRRLLSGLWRTQPKLPFWTTAAAASSSSRLFQSTAAAAAAPDAAETTKKASSDNNNNSNNQSLPSTTTTKIVADDSEFVKPDPDLRQYRWVKLANNLQVLLVSTTETSSSASDDDNAEETLSHVEAASVHVQAGHFDDTIPGVSVLWRILVCFENACFDLCIIWVVNAKNGWMLFEMCAPLTLVPFSVPLLHAIHHSVIT